MYGAHVGIVADLVQEAGQSLESLRKDADAL